MVRLEEGFGEGKESKIEALMMLQILMLSSKVVENFVTFKVGCLVIGRVFVVLIEFN